MAGNAGRGDLELDVPWVGRPDRAEEHVIAVGHIAGRGILFVCGVGLCNRALHVAIVEPHIVACRERNDELAAAQRVVGEAVAVAVLVARIDQLDHRPFRVNHGAALQHGHMSAGVAHHYLQLEAPAPAGVPLTPAAAAQGELVDVLVARRCRVACAAGVLDHAVHLVVAVRVAEQIVGELERQLNHRAA